MTNSLSMIVIKTDLDLTPPGARRFAIMPYGNKFIQCYVSGRKYCRFPATDAGLSIAQEWKGSTSAPGTSWDGHDFNPMVEV